MRFASSWNTASELAQQRRQAMLERIAQLRALEQRAADRSAQARPLFERRGQLLPRERIGLLLDPGRPWLPLCALAGYRQDQPDPQLSIPGAGIVAGIGFVSGVRCMVVASDSGIDAGALQAMGLAKILRVQELALQNRLPFIQLVESAGANLMQYRVEDFVQGGALFRNLARLAGAGVPVITVQHGPDRAGGAYMPGLGDVLVMVGGRSRVLPAGPPSSQAATKEEPGGAQAQSPESGLGEYLAQDDREALGMAREVLARVAPTFPPTGRVQEEVPAPVEEGWGGGARAEELLSLMPANLREALDPREIMVRLADDGSILEFKPFHGAATVCAQGRIAGHAVGFIGNNGPIDGAGADKASHFIRWLCQLGQPIVYLQNTTGDRVGKEGEQGGMSRHGSKMIQAVTHASVPQLTVQCGASFGAGNYGMCGRAYAPRFLFSWPGAQTALMDAEQAARTMQRVTGAALARKGMTPDPEQARARFDRIVGVFEQQADAFYTSGLLLDDGVIDPRDTRAVLAFCLDTIREAEAKQPRPLQFGMGCM